MKSRVKSKKVRIRSYFIMLLIILAGIGGTGLFLIIHNNDSRQMQEAANNFIHVLENKEYEKLGDVLEKQSYTSAGYTLKEVIDKYDAIFNGINIDNIQASKIKFEKIDDNEQELSFRLNATTPLGALENLEYHTKIVKTDGEYRVKWNPSLIFPGMEGKDKVAFRHWKAERGEMKDHLGNGLAINEVFKEAGIVPKDLSRGNEKEKRLQKISQQFDIPVEEIHEKLNQDWVKEDLFVPLKIIESNKAEVIPGISYQTAKLRYYPLKEAAAHLIGYVGKATKEDLEKTPHLAEGDMIGKAGLEKALDKELRGKDGGEILTVDENGEKKQEIQTLEKIDGKTIKLTIDNYIQMEAFKHLKGKPGSTVVMNPKEGGLYAAVSSPSFDPNKMAQGISQKDYDQYANDENKPFISRFATGYAPGSTFKAITSSIGLDAKVTYPNKLRKINGLSWQKDKTWGGYSVTRVSDVQNVDMRKALIYSDNIYFAQEALEMGEKTFRNGLKQFIFGEQLDLPIAMKAAQISNKSTFDSGILLADTAYGQGELLISPIQQAAMYSVFQNEGKVVYPRLLDEKRERKTKPAITSSTANEMKDRLEEVVSDPNGTAHLLYNEQHQLAAKTGTAELKMQQGEKGDENTFLLAFDAGNDQFLLLSLVEHYTAGSSATQLNQSFIEELYEYFQMR
ncbi:penicillin-binding transpeptidase domain-containing protein [Siminovitchia fortis]|uniref:serine-type D-Ala-D-Ala carboxypeptidase n=1 Tax=Siminovitchia fortis TaxID=254758 RepID=A0A443IK90_9BACI|nr:penicillin-binding transpeptidase domain-containing protein [Siminovitchia fortis]RWR04927.1 penicillin-binding transpeptidase domain-containing protein [Siminovitchia fortis]WHY82563.1 penicillin-binding transpeptidase domain-containing protein [Siminovitchia fortis]